MEYVLTFKGGKQEIKQCTTIDIAWMVKYKNLLSYKKVKKGIDKLIKL